jgi:hypothetical protein
MRIGQWLVVAGLLISAACGGSSSPGPSAVPQSLAISPRIDLVKIKAFETLSAALTASNGQQTAATATWTSDAPAVASIDANGRVTGQGSGSATIAAQASGLRDTLPVRVVPDYHGRWEGMTRVTGCADEGDFDTACDEVVGGGLPLSTSITQTRDAVTADVDFDGARGRISTTIQSSGRLVTTGQLTLTFEGIAFDVALSEWDTTSVDNQAMTGRYRLEVRHALLTGFWRLEGDFVSIQKTSGTPGVAAMSGISGRQSSSRLFSRLPRIAGRTR